MCVSPRFIIVIVIVIVNVTMLPSFDAFIEHNATVNKNKKICSQLWIPENMPKSLDFGMRVHLVWHRIFFNLPLSSFGFLFQSPLSCGKGAFDMIQKSK